MDDFAHIVGEDVHFRGRSPSGERGLKSAPHHVGVRPAGRSPSGERGLKLLLERHTGGDPWSLPIRGAWIEIRRAAS